jgi:ferrous iron transport protein B
VTKTSETRIPLSDISVSRRPSASIAVVGSPNSGKSTLFNRLTGLRQRIGNYPGVTVEKHIGTLKSDNKTIERMEGSQPPDAILAVVDATNLYQGLYLVQQLLDLERPIVVALTMSDAAETSGVVIDIDALTERLGGITICQVVATTGQGINELRNALVDLTDQPAPQPTTAWPELTKAAKELADAATVPLSKAEIERLLVDGATGANQNVLDCLGAGAAERVERYREELFGFDPPLAREARVRYKWVREVLQEVQQKTPPFYSWRTRLGAFLNRPIPGTIGLFLVMAIVFQAVFAWATPIMDLIDSGTVVLGSALPDGSCHALGRPVGPVNHSDDIELRMCGTRHHGDARHSESSRSNCDNSRRAVHDVLCATTGLCAPDRCVRACTGRRVS